MSESITLPVEILEGILAKSFDYGEMWEDYRARKMLSEDWIETQRDEVVKAIISEIKDKLVPDRTLTSRARKKIMQKHELNDAS